MIFSTTDPTLIRMIAENERQRGKAIKYGPLTDEERKDQAQNIEEVLEYFDPNISTLDSEPSLYAARIANRYEKTLQAKDGQIAALAQERSLWRERALRDKPPFAGELKISLQAKDDTIAELKAQLEAESDIQHAQRSEIQARDDTIKALVTACRKFSGLHDYAPIEEADAAWVDPQDRAEFDAEIKEATE